MSLMPPHEVLEAIVKAGEEEMWCSFDQNQRGFQAALQAWAANLQFGFSGPLMGMLCALGRQRSFD